MYDIRMIGNIGGIKRRNILMEIVCYRYRHNEYKINNRHQDPFDIRFLDCVEDIHT